MERLWGLKKADSQKFLDRGHALYAWAQERGMNYYWEDPWGLSAYPFRTFQDNLQVACCNVLVGNWKGIDVYVFDNLLKQPDRQDGRYGWALFAEQLTLVMVPFNGAVPWTAVDGKKSLFRNHPSRKSRVITPAPPAEDAAFNDMFRASSVDPNYASGLLNDQVRAWLVSRGPQFAIEFNQTNMLLIQQLTPVEHTEWLFDYAAGLARYYLKSCRGRTRPRFKTNPRSPAG